MTEPRIAVVYDSSEGQAEKIAGRIADEIRLKGADAEVFAAEHPPAAIDGFAAVIAGGSVHTGHHGKALRRFVEDHREALDAMPNAFFSVSLSAVKHDEQHDADVARLIDDFKRETGWEPQRVVSFAGALKYREYNWLIRQVMKRIAAKEGGDTDTSRDYEYTDWEAVEQFAGDFVASLQRP